MYCQKLPILILIPSYNAAHLLPELFKKIQESNCDIPVLVVNDGSTDNTEEIVFDYPCLYHSLAQNQGKGAALYQGLVWAHKHRYEWVITMDADGQHSPQVLNEFVAQIFELLSQNPQNSKKIIVGKRDFSQKNMPLGRKLSNSITTFLMSYLCKTPVYDSQCGFRAYPTQLIEIEELPKEGRFQWESEVLFWASLKGYTFSPVQIPTIYFEKGDSHIDHVSDTWRFIKMYFRLFKIAQ